MGYRRFEYRSSVAKSLTYNTTARLYRVGKKSVLSRQDLALSQIMIFRPASF
jgi:hypothetical protein